jgi:hypothetical protein
MLSGKSFSGFRLVYTNKFPTYIIDLHEANMPARWANGGLVAIHTVTDDMRLAYSQLTEADEVYINYERVQ